MQLDRLSFALRPRKSWTALDLGFNLAQRWWLAMCLRGLILLVPVLALALYVGHPFWGLVILWWFKPLYERPALLYLSNAVFAQELTRKEMTKGIVDSALLMHLTLGRLSWRRAAVASITLEQGKTADFRRRRRALYRDGAGLLLWVGIVGFFFEFFFASTMHSLVTGFFTTSESFTSNGSQWDGDSTAIAFTELGSIFEGWAYWEIAFILVCYSTAILVVSPFYVAASFSLYLNRRTLLEGWDIEVGFKKLVQRLGLVALVLCAIVPVDMHAADDVGHDQAIQELIQSGDFNQVRYIKLPELLRDFLEWLNEPEPEEEPTRPLVSRVLAVLLEVLFWVLLVGLVVYCIFRLRQFVDLESIFSGRDRQSKAALFKRKEELDVLAKKVVPLARAAWQERDFRRAYSLLYLGSLRSLRDNSDCNIRRDQTESECLRRTRHLPADVYGAFREITRSWQRIAYAGVTATQVDFDKSLALFQQHFEVV